MVICIILIVRGYTMKEYLDECLEYAKKEGIATVNQAKIRFIEVLQICSIEERTEFFKNFEDK